MLSWAGPGTQGLGLLTLWEVKRQRWAAHGSSIKCTQSSSSGRLIIFQRAASDTLRAESDGGDDVMWDMVSTSHLSQVSRCEGTSLVTIVSLFITHTGHVSHVSHVQTVFIFTKRWPGYWLGPVTSVLIHICGGWCSGDLWHVLALFGHNWHWPLAAETSWCLMTHHSDTDIDIVVIIITPSHACALLWPLWSPSGLWPVMSGHNDADHKSDHHGHLCSSARCNPSSSRWHLPTFHCHDWDDLWWHASPQYCKTRIQDLMSDDHLAPCQGTCCQHSVFFMIQMRANGRQYLIWVS